jgi:hypothetical protein
MSGDRNREIDLDDLDPRGSPDSETEDEFIEEMSEADLRVGVAGCWVHPEIPCMESCIAFNLYKEEEEPNCKVMMALEKIAEGQDNRDLMKEHNQILGKIEKTLAGLLQQLQRLSV